MNTQKRRKHIIQLLEKEGSVKTSELSEEFQVSVMTIRRDLNYLAGEGIVTLTHGGAALNRGGLTEHAMLYKEDTRIEEKRRIARILFQFCQRGGCGADRYGLYCKNGGSDSDQPEKYRGRDPFPAGTGYAVPCVGDQIDRCSRGVPGKDHGLSGADDL